MSDTSRPRVLIADDHILIAEAFKKLLAIEFEIVATVYDGRSLIQTAQAVMPDVILVDIGMPLLNGLEAADRIKRLMPRVKIVYVTVNQDPDLIAEAFLRGASGYVLKTSAASELTIAIRCAVRGDSYVSKPLAAFSPQLRFDRSDPRPNDLTDRQLEVLQLLAEGRSMKEVAGVLNLATRTVAFHKYRIMETLGLRSDAQVVQYAMRKHMVFGDNKSRIRPCAAAPKIGRAHV